jgi:hypothetical protein
MEKKIKELALIELNNEELLGNNGGKERMDEKQTKFWETIFKYFIP